MITINVEKSLLGMFINSSLAGWGAEEGGRVGGARGIVLFVLIIHSFVWKTLENFANGPHQYGLLQIVLI